MKNITGEDPIKLTKKKKNDVHFAQTRLMQIPTGYDKSTLPFVMTPGTER